MGSEIVSGITHLSTKSIINKNVHNELLAAPDDNITTNVTNINRKNDNNELSPLIGNTSVNVITPASDRSIINKNVQYSSLTSSTVDVQLNATNIIT